MCGLSVYKYCYYSFNIIMNSVKTVIEVLKDYYESNI